MPHSEVGFAVIAAIGAWRLGEHRSVPEIHQALRRRGVPIAERTVTPLIERSEALVALRLSDQPDLWERLEWQGAVILELDGMQLEVGHEVLWVIRDCLSGEVLLKEVRAGLTVPVRGVGSDGQPSIRNAVARVFPDAPSNSARSRICVTRPGRSTRPTATPKSRSRRKSAGSVRASAPSKAAPMRRRPRRAATAWRSAAP